MDVHFTAVAKGRESAATGFTKGLDIPHVIVFMLGSCACMLETAVVTVDQQLWDFVCKQQSHHGFQGELF